MILGYGSFELEFFDFELIFVGGSFSDKVVRRGFIRKVKGGLEILIYKLMVFLNFRFLVYLLIVCLIVILY